MKALREALVELVQFTCNSCQERLCESDCEEEDGQSVPVPCSAILKARAALAAPARNCDMGTADEQSMRMNEFCDSHGHGFDGQKCYSCENCRFISIDRCELAWAQLPYESEAAK